MPVYLKRLRTISPAMMGNPLLDSRIVRHDRDDSMWWKTNLSTREIEPLLPGMTKEMPLWIRRYCRLVYNGEDILITLSPELAREVAADFQLMGFQVDFEEVERNPC